MHRIVVSDSTALIALARINALGILRQLYSEVLVPRAVFEEAAGSGTMKASAVRIRNSPWIRTVEVKNRTVVRRLERQLDLGESEAIALSIELHADVLIIDEAKGRKIARQLVSRIIGVLGMLLLAKEKRVIREIAPYIRELRREDFRMSDALVKFALRQAGELDAEAGSGSS